MTMLGFQDRWQQHPFSYLIGLRGVKRKGSFQDEPNHP